MKAARRKPQEACPAAARQLLLAPRISHKIGNHGEPWLLEFFVLFSSEIEMTISKSPPTPTQKI
eukprot:scaffold4542_cov150-Skeletonema_dohrnii-CCMP3373.AAC.9